jgi:hypothetical protein
MYQEKSGNPDVYSLLRQIMRPSPPRIACDNELPVLRMHIRQNIEIWIREQMQESVSEARSGHRLRQQNIIPNLARVYIRF